MTAACELSSQYYKMITKFSVLDIEKTPTNLCYNMQIFLVKVIFHRKTVKLAD